MAKRFYNTTRIEEDWYIDLSCKHRELLRYCESKCDGAGIFSWNSKIASTYIGERVSDSDLLTLPVSKITNGKYFIHGFCFFQNGILSRKSPAHNPIFKSLEENKITEDTLLYTLSDTLHGRELDREIVKEEVQEIEKDKEQVQEKDPVFKNELTQTFDKWVDMRKKMKGGITEHAIELGRSEIKKLAGSNVDLAIEVINQSLLNSWKGFFPIKNGQYTKQVNGKQTAEDILTINQLAKNAI